MKGYTIVEAVRAQLLKRLTLDSESPDLKTDSIIHYLGDLRIIT